MLAAKTFHHVLNIIYEHLYHDWKGVEMTKERFIRVFPQEVMKEPEPHVLKKNYYPFQISKVKSSYREKILNGGNDFPIYAAEKLKDKMDRENNGLSQRIDELEEITNGVSVFVKDFASLGIELDESDLSYSVQEVLLLYCSAISRKRPDPFGVDEKEAQKKSFIGIENGILYMNGKTFNIADITDKNYEMQPESKHETELIEALGASNENALDERGHMILETQRIAYTTAICNRNNLRDCLEDGCPVYEKIINEVCSGVVLSYYDMYPTPWQRAKAVLDKASDIHLGGTRLARETGLIDINNRQGICHILIDENEKFKKGWKLS